MRNHTHFFKKPHVFFALFATLMIWQSAAFSAVSYRFGVTNIETIMTTAAYWNPILAWIEKQTGVSLVLQMGITAEETQARLMRGEYDFFYGYPLLQPQVRDKLNFHVLLKNKSVINTSAIVVQSNSSYFALKDLNNKRLWMPYPSAFIAHSLPMATLLAQGIHVQPQLVANQESVISAFKLGQIQAVSVNMRIFEKLMKDHVQSYRVLWRSPPLLSLPIGAQESVPLGVVERVQAAFVAMIDDPEGKLILQTINQRMGLKLAGWEIASDKEYQFAIDSYHYLLEKISKVE